MPLLGDPQARLKRVVGYVVTMVWAITFIASVLLPHRDTTALLAVQAVMMMVAGALYVDRKTVPTEDGGDPEPEPTPDPEPTPPPEPEPTPPPTRRKRPPKEGTADAGDA